MEEKRFGISQDKLESGIMQVVANLEDCGLNIFERYWGEDNSRSAVLPPLIGDQWDNKNTSAILDARVRKASGVFNVSL